MKAIDLVLPAYKEEQGIAAFHASLKRALDPVSDRYQFHFVYVVDPSADATFNVLRDVAADDPDVTVIHLSRRFGHQAALMAGLDRSRGDAAIMMDTDLQHPPAVVPELLARFEQGFDVVQTVRRYGPNVGWFKQATSHLFYAAQNLLSPVDIQPGMSDFRLVSRRVVVVFQDRMREQNPFLRGLFQWIGFRRTEVSFVSEDRRAGTTKYPLGKLLTFSFVGLVSFSKIPLRVAALLGLSISSLGAVYGVWLFWQFVTRGGFPPGYASLILVVLVLGGLQLLFLGVIGEYLGSIFDEVKHRPLYVVDEVVERRRA